MTAPTHTLNLDTGHEALRRIGPWLNDLCDDTAFGVRTGEIELAVHEVAMNIVDHAYDEESRASGSVEITAELDGEQLVIRLLDEGAGLERWPEAPDPANPQVRGYGMMIVEQLASTVSYARTDGQNRWTLTFGAPQ